MGKNIGLGTCSFGSPSKGICSPFSAYSSGILAEGAAFPGHRSSFGASGSFRRKIKLLWVRNYLQLHIILLLF